MHEMQLIHCATQPEARLSKQLQDTILCRLYPCSLSTAACICTVQMNTRANCMQYILGKSLIENMS